jgi:NADH dehydrogenase
MNSKPIKICILGGGFGGLYTALSLSRCSGVKSGNWQMTLVEQNDRFLFTPLLYELLTGELQPWEIAPSYQKLLRHTAIAFYQQRIQEIDLNSRQVSLASGESLSYDYLVLAVGSQNRWADIPGLATYALTFRTLADVECLQARLSALEASTRAGLSLAVIGGGPNGVELACKLADRLRKRGKVHLIECGGEILKGFSGGVRRAAYRAIAARGIQLALNTSVRAIDADCMALQQGDRDIQLPVDLVIWAAGTQSREWIDRLGCQQNCQGKLLTRSTLQLVDYPEVWALGDVAEIDGGNQFVPATAQAAYQQARIAAKNIRAAIAGKRLHRFRYFHLGDMLTLGRGAAVVSSFFLNLEGKLAAAVRRLAYILRLPTPRHRFQVLKQLLKKLVLKIVRSLSLTLKTLFFQRFTRKYEGVSLKKTIK